MDSSASCTGNASPRRSCTANRPFPSMPIAMRRAQSASGRPTYVFQHAHQDPAATLDDIRESVTMLEETGRTAQRVMGGANPLTMGIKEGLRQARAALRARETPSPTRRTFAPGWLDGPG